MPDCATSPVDVPGFLRKYDALDRALVAAGFPATSGWWRAKIERFFRSGRRRWVLRVGRRGGKSSTLARLAVAWVLWGAWAIPPGDVGVVPIVSVDRTEAAGRIRTIQAILEAIGIDYGLRGQEIDVPERRAMFRVTTCNLTATVGFTSIMLWADEMAKWQSGDDHANPAKQVMASLRPTKITVPNAFEVDVSAPWGMDDYHAELFAEGDTDHQIVDHAATWEAHPELTEELTHAEEPDLNEWSRAYAAIPSTVVTGDWFGVGLDMALSQPRVVEPILPWVRYTVAIDPAFAKDHFGWAVLSSRAPPTLSPTERPRRLTRVHAAGEWVIGDQKPLQLAERLRDEVCRPYGILRDWGNGELSQVITDQYEGFSFTELARQAGVLLQVVPWTGGGGETSQVTRFRSVRLAMLEGTFLLSDDDALIAQLRAVKCKTLPSGNESIVLPRNQAGGHFDRIAALVLGASEVMTRAPQEELIQQAAPREQDVMREAAKQKVIKKRMDEWKRDPQNAMRRAMRMG